MYLFFSFLFLLAPLPGVCSFAVYGLNLRIILSQMFKISTLLIFEPPEINLGWTLTIVRKTPVTALPELAYILRPEYLKMTNLRRGTNV